MSDQPPSEDELKSGKEGLAHVETKSGSERKVVLACAQCGEQADYPVCDECGEPMDYEETVFKCQHREEPVPEHCGQVMTPKIV